MDERYLYKAKRLDDREWVEGYLFFSWERAYILWGTINGVPDMIEVDHETICMCTGLRDRNNKLIWENDIIAFEDIYSTESGYGEMDSIGTVLWDDKTLSFQATGRLSAESCEVLSDCVVFGNIFDNLELLEVGK